MVEPVPILFTYTPMGKQVMFGLLTSTPACGTQPSTYGLHPVRAFARSLHAPPVPDGLDLILIGKECLEWLAEHDLLEPILHAMADDMHRAVMTRCSKKAQGTDKRFKPVTEYNRYWS